MDKKWYETIHTITFILSKQIKNKEVILIQEETSFFSRSQIPIPILWEDKTYKEV